MGCFNLKALFYTEYAYLFESVFFLCLIQIKTLPGEVQQPFVAVAVGAAQMGWWPLSPVLWPLSPVLWPPGLPTSQRPLRLLLTGSPTWEFSFLDCKGTSCFNSKTMHGIFLNPFVKSGCWVSGRTVGGSCAVFVCQLQVPQRRFLCLDRNLVLVDLELMGNQWTDPLKLERNSSLWFIPGVYFDHLYLTVVCFCQAYSFWD